MKTIIILTLALLFVISGCTTQELTDEELCIQQGGTYIECGPNDCQLAGGEICPRVCGPPICRFQ